METPCWCPSEGYQYGGRKVTETAVVEFCYVNQYVITRGIVYTLGNTSSNARTVQKAKTFK